MTRSSILVSAVVVLAAAPAAAQNSAAIAEGLFREGKHLLDERRYAEACPKFAESARLDPSSGVELALGLCYEALGKTASAWGAYEGAISLARRDKRKDREKAAAAHAEALEPKVPHATISVPPEVAKLEGLVVREDTVAMGAAAWSNAPIDPGSHTIDVTATGKKPWSTTFTIDNAGTKTITVSALEDEPVAVVVTPDSHTTPVIVTQPAPSSPLRPISYVAFSLGLGAAVGASILGAIAISDANDVKKTCSPPTCTDARAVSENGNAATLADWSTVLFISAGVLVTAAVILFVIPPPRAEAHAYVRPILAPGYAGLGGAF